MKYINIVGVTTHIGSQLTDLQPFSAAFERIKMLVEELRKQGHTISRLDLGGGLGIPYKNEKPPTPKEYADMIISTVKDLNCKLILEPGRLIVGNAGVLISKIIRIKYTDIKDFIIIDAAMNDLTRPSLYCSYHEIIAVQQKDVTFEKYDIVGSICESSDVFARDRVLPKLQSEDLIAIRSAGAYGATMSSTYNSRLLVPEIIVENNEYKIIRPRQTYQQLFDLELGL